MMRELIHYPLKMRLIPHEIASAGAAGEGAENWVALPTGERVFSLPVITTARVSGSPLSASGTEC
jgi:hypothetical protein